jgi:phage protein D
MAESPEKYANDLVTHKILSGGSQIDDSFNIISISVENNLNRIPNATIRLHDGDVSDQSFNASDSSVFLPGTEIEIQAGYLSENEETIFKGIVVSMRFVVDSELGSTLEVNCSDKSIMMTETRNNAYFSKIKDSDIISTLIGNYGGLSSNVKATSYEHKELVQYDTTDWDFMMLRADINGCIAAINQGEITVQPPATSASPTLSLTYGVDLMEFEADLSAAPQASSVKAVAWDISNQAIDNQSGSEPGFTAPGNITAKKLGTALGTSDETLVTNAYIESSMLKVWADARLLKVRLATYTGTAKFTGSAKALPNTLIELNGVGDRFSGNLCFRCNPCY